MNQIRSERFAFFQPLAAGLIAFSFLAWLAWNPAPYEQDQPAKAAKIIFMQQTGNYLHPLAGQEYYHDEMFTLYYIMESCLQGILRGDVYLEMNLSSAVAGGIFCALISIVLRRVFSIPVWLTVLMALHTPVFAQVFSFGNEAAFSLAASSVVLLLLTAPTIHKCFAAGIIYGLGMHCRPDGIFLAPFLFIWCWVRVGNVPVSSRVKTLFCFAATTGIVGLAWWLIFVRRLPTETGLDMKFVPKYFAGMMFYPFLAALTPAAIVGAMQLARNRLLYFLAMLTALVPLAYTPQATSPKFCAVMMLPVWTAAGVALSQRGWWLRAVTVFLAAMLWLFSITPFGMFFGARGANWFFPTDDGPVPTGSYACFFKNVHDGVYQRRYVLEQGQIRQMLLRLDEKTDAVPCGFMDSQEIFFALAEKSRFETTLGDIGWLGDSVPTNIPVLLIKTTYLRLNTFSAPQQKLLRTWLEEGRLRSVAAVNDDPFPDVIEMGGHISAGENVELGRRILFALEHSGGNGYVRREKFSSDLDSTRWLPGSQESPIEQSLAYTDGRFACYTNDADGGIIYASVMPSQYYHITDPRNRWKNEPAAK